MGSLRSRSASSWRRLGLPKSRYARRYLLLATAICCGPAQSWSYRSQLSDCSSPTMAADFAERLHRLAVRVSDAGWTRIEPNKRQVYAALVNGIKAQIRSGVASTEDASNLRTRVQAALTDLGEPFFVDWGWTPPEERAPKRPPTPFVASTSVSNKAVD